MTRDWHATYLTDGTTMAAVRDHSARTGEDGWSAAVMLVRTVAPEPGSHEAAGARAVLMPASPLTEEDERELLCASRFGSEQSRFSLPDLIRVPVDWIEPSPVDVGAMLAEAAEAAERRIRGLGELVAQRVTVFADEAASLLTPPYISMDFGNLGSSSSDQGDYLPSAFFQIYRGANWVRAPWLQPFQPGGDWLNEPDPPHLRLDDDHRTLRHLLEQVRANALTVEEVADHPAVAEARRRRLIVEPSPRLGRKPRKVGAGVRLTELGKLELRRLKADEHQRDQQIRMPRPDTPAVLSPRIAEEFGDAW